MQFEVAEPYRKQAKADFFWVLPPVLRENYLRDCACAVMYPVVEALAVTRKEYMAQARTVLDAPGAGFFVCACFGKVIE